MKPRPERVIEARAREALLTIAKGDPRKLYSAYILLSYRHTGSLTPGCDNRDLQAWYQATYLATRTKPA